MQPQPAMLTMQPLAARAQAAARCPGLNNAGARKVQHSDGKILDYSVASAVTTNLWGGRVHHCVRAAWFDGWHV